MDVVIKVEDEDPAFTSHPQQIKRENFYNNFKDDIESFAPAMQSQTALRLHVNRTMHQWIDTTNVRRIKKECFICSTPMLTPGGDKYYHFITVHKNFFNSLFPDVQDLMCRRMVIFAVRYFMSFVGRLQNDNIQVKNVQKVQQRLGVDYIDFIRKDLKMGMVVYFTTQQPYFLIDEEDVNQLKSPGREIRHSAIAVPHRTEYLSWVGSASGHRAAEAVRENLLRNECVHNVYSCKECTYLPKAMKLCPHNLPVTKCFAFSCFNDHKSKFTKL